MTQLRVLHVDDEPDIREVTAMSIELDDSIDLTSCGSGREALSALEAGLRPDIILLDVTMPDLDGPATLANLRRIDGLQETPVLFMTARAQSQDMDRYLSLGASGIILKPFDPISLAKNIRSAVRQPLPAT